MVQGPNDSRPSNWYRAAAATPGPAAGVALAGHRAAAHNRYARGGGGANERRGRSMRMEPEVGLYVGKVFGGWGWRWQAGGCRAVVNHRVGGCAAACSCLSLDRGIETKFLLSLNKLDAEGGGCYPKIADDKQAQSTVVVNTSQRDRLCLSL